MNKFYDDMGLITNLRFVVVGGDDHDRMRSLLAKQEVDLTVEGVSSKTKILNNYAWNFGDADESSRYPTVRNASDIRDVDFSLPDQEFTEKLLEALERDPEISDEPTEKELRFLAAKSATLEGKRIEVISDWKPPVKEVKEEEKKDDVVVEKSENIDDSEAKEGEKKDIAGDKEEEKKDDGPDVVKVPDGDAEEKKDDAEEKKDDAEAGEKPFSFAELCNAQPFDNLMTRISNNPRSKDNDRLTHPLNFKKASGFVREDE